MVERIIFLELDDLRADLHDAGWATELSSKMSSEVDGYLGHEISITRFIERNRSKLDMLASNANELFPALKHLQQLSTHMDTKHGYLLEVIPSTPLSGVKQLLEPIEHYQSSYEISDYMMSEQWGYTDSISSPRQSPTIRKLSYERWFWHDVPLGAPVSFSTFASVNANWNTISLKLAKTALKAWQDFPEAIPYQNSFGDVVVDKFKTEIVFGTK